MQLTSTDRNPDRNSFKIVLINQDRDDLAITGIGLIMMRAIKISHASGQVVGFTVGAPKRENEDQNAKHNVPRSKLGIYFEHL